MNNWNLGNCISGNFSSNEPMGKDPCTLEKRDGTLYLQSSTKSIALTPMDDDAEMIVVRFSSDIEFNESIYDIQDVGTHIIVILYTYGAVKKLLGADQMMYIHLMRTDEKQILSEGGLADHHVDDITDIVPYLTDLFINNKSIFVQLTPKKTDEFQMFGRNGIRANVKMVRPGVYCIERFYKTRNTNYSFELTQLYGNIQFILYERSCEISGNDISRHFPVRTNEIFRAWDEYMELEKRIYEEDLREQGILRYSAVKTDGECLIFTLEKQDIGTVSEEVEFEFYSGYSEEGGREIPTDVDLLLLKKQQDRRASIFLGKARGIGNRELVFDMPRFGYVKEMEQYDGIIYVSDHSLQIEVNRRKKVLKAIQTRQNESSNIIMRLSEADVEDDQPGTSYGPTNSDVLRCMFGTIDVTLKETYRKAMSIALNTPDIALIQGPPGTGKTTLIKGLITRLNGMNCNYRILVSSEQHEALYNVVEKLARNKFIPPFVSSRKYDTDGSQEDQERFENTVREFQRNFIGLCEELLKEGDGGERRSAKITSLIYEIQKIRDNKYSKNYILTVFDTLKSKIVALDENSNLSADLLALEQILRIPQKGSKPEELDFLTRKLIEKIEAQRDEIDVFLEDDGEYQLKALQRLLERNEMKELCLDSETLLLLQSGEENTVRSVFDRYIEYVKMLKKKIIFTASTGFDEDNTENIKSIVEKIAKGVAELSRPSNPTFFDVVEQLTFKLGDIDNAAGVISKYTTIVGSTCAQAEKSVDMMDLRNDRYDYVIIDEAARANPLDIMIPMMMGSKIVLIGDHKQLPHYIESKYVERFNQEKEKYADFDVTLLTKSLFQILYENLEKAYNEGRLKFQRTIQIDEQHRMHPVIGKFISDEFYEGRIQNGERTVNNKNDYRVYDGKNVVWIDVPIFEGTETFVNHSYERKCEVDRIIELVRELINKNADRKLNIGIISFYKGQAELIQNSLNEAFPSGIVENISCNTVDSYQGKEFDIVILSGTRSNMYTVAQRSLGFINNSHSRINVALSRAKKLLIVVADAGTYQRNDHFAKFISYVKREGYYV